jgi:hypothetical protein
MTLAHAAVVPPMMRVTRRRLVLSAVVVGSMAPDFESLVHLSSHKTVSHTVPGLFVFCLPVTVAVLAVWHGVVKRPLASLLLPRLAPVAAVAGQPFSFGPVSRFLAICTSTVAGSATHIAWDSFTHEDGFFVQHIQWLRQSIHWHGLAVFDLLQYGSGLAGLVLLGFWWHRWTERQSTTAHPGSPPSRPVTPAPGRIRRTALSAIVALTASAGAANALRGVVDGLRAREVVAHGVFGAMAGWALAVVVAGVVLSRRRPHEAV